VSGGDPGGGPGGGSSTVETGGSPTVDTGYPTVIPFAPSSHQAKLQANIYETVAAQHRNDCKQNMQEEMQTEYSYTFIYCDYVWNRILFGYSHIRICVCCITSSSSISFRQREEACNNICTGRGKGGSKRCGGGLSDCPFETTDSSQREVRYLDILVLAHSFGFHVKIRSTNMIHTLYLQELCRIPYREAG